MPQLSNRMTETDMPMIGKVGELIQQVIKESDSPIQINNLVQGMVYWGPPDSCIQSMKEHVSDSDMHKYCEHDFGTRALRDAIQQKLQTENGLFNHQVIITAGANQGFASVVNACCDPGDEAVMFAPYYFNHRMALQMSNVNPLVIETFVQNKYLPTRSDFDHLQQQISSGEKSRIKMVIICDPCNPTGAVYPQDLLEYISEFCKRNGIWMVCDETYEYFVFNGEKHHTPSGDHIIHLYSFSKAYGLMGWRVGYIAYDSINHPQLTSHLHKYQDTVPISCSVASQAMALEALKVGKGYAMSQINTLQLNREYLWDALKDYENSAHTDGAMYFFAQFPNFSHRTTPVSVEEEWKVIEWLVRKHKVAVLPGSAFGSNGWFRVSYANLNNDQCKKAAKNIACALQELASPDFVLE